MIVCKTRKASQGVFEPHSESEAMQTVAIICENTQDGQAAVEGVDTPSKNTGETRISEYSAAISGARNANITDVDYIRDRWPHLSDKEIAVVLFLVQRNG